MLDELRKLLDTCKIGTRLVTYESLVGPFLSEIRNESFTLFFDFFRLKFTEVIAVHGSLFRFRYFLCFLKIKKILFQGGFATSWAANVPFGVFLKDS